MEKFIQNIIDELAPICFKIVFTILILVVGLALVKLLIKFIKKSRGFSHISDSAKQFSISFIRISLNILVVFSAAIVLGFPAASIVTVLASAGAAIGLAMQGSLSNLAGGMMLVIFKPFKIGDFITADSNSGTVKDITVFYTTLVTPDNRTITLPNGKLTNTAILNGTANETRRMDMMYSVAYGSNIDDVRRILLDVAEKTEGVLNEPAATVVLSKHNDSSLDFCLLCWCKSTDFVPVSMNLNEAVKRAFDDNKIEIPFPQLDVHIQNK